MGKGLFTSPGDGGASGVQGSARHGRCPIPLGSAVQRRGYERRHGRNTARLLAWVFEKKRILQGFGEVALLVDAHNRSALSRA